VWRTGQERDQSISASAAEADPKLIRPKRIDFAADEPSFLEHGNPSGEHRFWSNFVQVSEREFSVSKFGGQQLEQDIPGRIRKESLAENIGAAAPDVQNRLDLIFC
jgi:hypothetical protein